MIFHERSREATAFKNRLQKQAFYGILPDSEQTNNQGMTDATTIDYIKQKTLKRGIYGKGRRCYPKLHGMACHEIESSPETVKENSFHRAR